MNASKDVFSPHRPRRFAGSTRGFHNEQGGDTPETERVRIFVAYEKQESAVKGRLRGRIGGAEGGKRRFVAPGTSEDILVGLLLLCRHA